MTGEPLRVLVGAIGLAGHALPAIALARELGARGHTVRMHTFERWRETVTGAGLEFAGTGGHIVALARDRAAGGEPDGRAGRDAPLAEVVRALLPSVDDLRADIVISDGLTLAPALAAEVRGLPRATLYPEVYPVHAPGLPPFSLGLLPPRSRIGAAAWRAIGSVAATRLPTTAWLEAARADLDAQRAELGLPPAEPDAPAGEGLTLVATLPQLEYPREWPADTHVTGPMALDPRYPAVNIPDGPEPLVVVAPSTVKDPKGDLVRAALDALADEPVRLVVSTGGGAIELAEPPPTNAVIADWLDYAQVMPRASLVICHGNHGTVVRALGAGVPVLVSPAMPDDAEHGARVAWAGVGLMVPRRMLGTGSLRAAVRRALGDRGLAERARRISAWCEGNPGPAVGADLVESYASRSR